MREEQAKYAVKIQLLVGSIQHICHATMAGVIRAVLLLLAIAGSAESAGKIIVQGAGASFPNLLYQDLIFAYQFVAPDVTLSYLATGSTGGKCRIMVRRHALFAFIVWRSCWLRFSRLWAIQDQICDLVLQIVMPVCRCASN